VTGNDILFEIEDVQDRKQQYKMPANVIGDFAEVKDPLQALGIAPALPVFPAVVKSVTPTGAANAAGIKAGDHILSADGVDMQNWQPWVKYVRARPGQLIKLQLERDGQLLNLDLIPKANGSKDKPIGYVGVEVLIPEGAFDDYRVHYSLGPLQAVPAAMVKTWDYSVLTLKMMWRMLTGQASLKNLGGPITVATVAGQAVSSGLVYFIKLLAVISVSLGILNLLPIPILDGGQLVYFMLEAIRGKPLSDKAMLQAQQVGLVLLLSLMGLVFYQDIARLVS